jgi:hypothetical protein
MGIISGASSAGRFFEGFSSSSAAGGAAEDEPISSSLVMIQQ